MSLQKYYDELTGPRMEFLRRGHRSSVLTIPSVQPLHSAQRDQLPQNFQSIGSRGVNSLVSKLMLTLFPSTIPFMRLELSPFDSYKIAAELTNEFGEGAEEKVAQTLSEIEASLLAIEQQAMSEFDTSGMRPAVAEVMRLLVVVGNGLIFERPGGAKPAVFDLRNYVVERDPEFNLLKVVLRQQIADSVAAQLFPDVALPTTQSSFTANVMSQTPTRALFSGAVRLPDGNFEYWQEVDGMEVSGTRRVVSEVDLPLRPLVFQPVHGFHYGRGYVEEYDGDLLSLESLSRALVEGSLALAKILWLVRPGGSTRQATLAKAPNGAIKTGNVEDVGAVQANKASDLSIAFQLRNELVIGLSRAFLLNSSVQRQGERVTAEEIRFVSQELEDTLGSVYASLADTVQRPIVLASFSRMKNEGLLAGLPSSVKPVVATGLEAISRGHKVTRINQFTNIIQQLVGPDRAGEFLRLHVIAKDLAMGLSLDGKRYVKSDEEIAQAQQEAQAQQAVGALGPEAIKAMSNSTQ